MIMIEVKVVSKEIIEPSSPTPHHLKTFNLSFLDQIAPPIYVPIILFYANDGHDGRIESLERCLRLKKSLAETLTRFYQLAGRIKGDKFIDCNDKGVDFFEARVNGLVLSDVIKQPNADLLKQFLPFDPYRSGPGFDSESESKVLLSIQVNVFDSGGMVIGVCISHKTADASSLCTFVKAWAATTHGSSKPIHPHFELASLFPYRDLLGFKASGSVRKEKIVTKRFVFDASSIATLRAKATNGSCVHPTRVEALSAFIWKRFMVLTQEKQKPGKSYAVIHALNLRGRMVPPLPDNTFGNMYTISIAPLAVEMEKNEHNLVGEIRNAISEIDGDYVSKLQKSSDRYQNSVKENEKRICKGEFMLLNFSSWCRFPLYEADFGWGKPTWVTTTSIPFKNVVVLMDTKLGDGIEAWVNMVEEDMAEFEQDKEILKFVSSTQDAY